MNGRSPTAMVDRQERIMRVYFAHFEELSKKVPQNMLLNIRDRNSLYICPLFPAFFPGFLAYLYKKH